MRKPVRLARAGSLGRCIAAPEARAESGYSSGGTFRRCRTCGFVTGHTGCSAAPGAWAGAAQGHPAALAAACSRPVERATGRRRQTYFPDRF